MKKIQFLVIATILSFGLIISSALISNMVDKVNKRQDTITIKGVSEQVINADRTILNINIYTSNKDSKLAYEKINDNMSKIITKLKEFGLDDSEIKIGNIKTEVVYKSETNTVEKYNIYQTVTVDTKKINDIQNYSLEISKMSIDIENLTVEDPEFYVTNVEKYRKELIINATKNSQNRAIDILKVSNKRIGELKKLTQDQYEIFSSVDSNSTKQDKLLEVNQKQKLIRASVTAKYVIK